MSTKLFADLVIKNANIWTLDDDNPRAEALVIFSDTLLKIVSNEEVEKFIGSSTEILELAGQTVLPGFIDAHTHIAWNGMNKVYLDLSKTKSLVEAIELVKSEIEKKKPGEWIIGRSWDQANWTEQRYITAADLDPISLENPIHLRHVSGHFETVNSLGFERLGLSKDMQGVDIDENGNITGTLRDLDHSQLDPVKRQELRPTFHEFVKGLNYGMDECLSLGITSVHDNITFELLPVYSHLVKQHKLKLRVYGIVYEDMIDEVIKLGIDRNFGDKWFRIGAVKLMTDGAISSRTAYLFDDYIDKEGEKGFALYDDDRLDEMVTKTHNANLQLAVHAIGDKNVRRFFYRQAQGNGAPDSARSAGNQDNLICKRHG